MNSIVQPHRIEPSTQSEFYRSTKCQSNGKKVSLVNGDGILSKVIHTTTDSPLRCYINLMKLSRRDGDGFRSVDKSMLRYLSTSNTQACHPTPPTHTLMILELNRSVKLSMPQAVRVHGHYFSDQLLRTRQHHRSEDGQLERQKTLVKKYSGSLE